MNPRLGQQNGNIIAVLEQQRQAAQQESSAMKAAIRSSVSAASARTPALSTNFAGNATTPGLAPGHTQSAPGNVASSIATLPFFNSLPITCTASNRAPARGKEDGLHAARSLNCRSAHQVAEIQFATEQNQGWFYSPSGAAERLPYIRSKRMAPLPDGLHFLRMHTISSQ